MSHIRFPCPACDKVLKVSHKKAGARGQCPSCREPIVIPPSEVPEDTDTYGVAVPDPYEFEESLDAPKLPERRKTRSGQSKKSGRVALEIIPPPVVREATPTYPFVSRFLQDTIGNHLSQWPDAFSSGNVKLAFFKYSVEENESRSEVSIEINAHGKLAGKKFARTFSHIFKADRSNYRRVQEIVRPKAARIRDAIERARAASGAAERSHNKTINSRTTRAGQKLAIEILRYLDSTVKRKSRLKTGWRIALGLCALVTLGVAYTSATLKSDIDGESVMGWTALSLGIMGLPTFMGCRLIAGIFMPKRFFNSEPAAIRLRHSVRRVTNEFLRLRLFLQAVICFAFAGVGWWVIHFQMV